MRQFRFLAAASLLILAACDDPSNVGLGLVEEQSGSPTEVELPHEEVFALTGSDLTGASLRILAGSVNDPELGTIQAVGALDFSQSAATGDVFLTNTVRGAWLVLQRNYVYGDTTNDVTITVREIQEAWEDDDVEADTNLVYGAPLTQFTFSQTASRIEIPLPETWVAEYDTTLRGVTFAENFHGFGVSYDGTNSITGFGGFSSFIKAEAAGDTAFFPVVQTLTEIDSDIRRDAIEPGFTLLQDGTSPGIGIRFDLQDASLDRSALHRGIVVVEADTTLPTPPGFLRPYPESIRIDAVSDDPPARLGLGSATFNREDGTYRFESDLLFGVLRSAFLGNEELDRFELVVPEADNTLSTILIRSDQLAGTPVMRLTLTPVR